MFCSSSRTLPQCVRVTHCCTSCSWETLRGRDKRLHSWRTPGGEAPTLDSSRSLSCLPGVSVGKKNRTKCTSLRFWQQLRPVPTAVASRGYTGNGSFQLISSHFSASSLFFLIARSSVVHAQGSAVRTHARLRSVVGWGECCLQVVSEIMCNRVMTQQNNYMK